MWSEEGNMSDVTTIGLYKWCGQKEFYIYNVAREGNTNEVARIG